MEPRTLSKPQRSASVKFIFATILLDALGIGLLIPVMPDVIRRFSQDPQVVNTYFGYFVAVYALMQFVASPILGSLSDRYGRRPVLLLSLLCAGLDYLLMVFSPNLWVLFLGRVISGLTGASMTVASSYMADVSTDENRSANFGMIGAAWGMGFIFGPALGGLIGEYGFYWPFVLAAIMNLLNFAFGYFILPESLPESLRRPLDASKLNPFASLAKILRPSPISALVYVFFLLFLAGNSHPAIWTLYSEYKFDWSAQDVGLSLSFVGLTMAFSQGYLTRVVIPKFGERRSMMIGLVFYFIGFLCWALITQGWMVYVVSAATILAGITMPALQSIVTAHVPADRQGELQGSLISLGSLAAIFAPLLYTWLFTTFTGPNAVAEFPGMPYLVAGAICALCAPVLMIALRRLPVAGKAE
ncbi:MAG: TCR/Tet family MFS transporter [Bdellovibrionaceae bacterium]|nr:TCR/Tet family MFS transporter [Pseudobdellovibrionaceae bacterium]